MTLPIDVEPERSARVRRRGASRSSQATVVDDKRVDGARAALVDDQYATALVELNLGGDGSPGAERLNRARNRFGSTIVIQTRARN